MSKYVGLEVEFGLMKMMIQKVLKKSTLYLMGAKNWDTYKSLGIRWTLSFWL